MASSLRVFENMNRGVATIIEALALATEQRQGLRSASSSLSGLLHPPWCIINPRSSFFRAACPSPHQSEVAHPAFCHKPQTSDAIQFATFRETKPSLLLFGPRRSACRHHMSIRFLAPMRLSHRGIGDRHANRRKNTMGWTCAA
jgi:hypothetical protein